MLMQAEEKKIYTTDEYLEFEVNSDTRHEYINGKIIPITGGTPEHNEIASILNAALRMSLKGKPYSIFVADQRLWIPNRNLYTYPDVMVAPRPYDGLEACILLASISSEICLADLYEGVEFKP